MGIYIKGMEMPKICDDCFLPLQYCPYAMKPNGECPLVPVPPHGRLGDLDALADKHRSKAYENGGRSYDFHATAKAWVEDAPTIIEAEE